MQNDARDSTFRASESFISTSELRIGKYSCMWADVIYIPSEYNEACRLSTQRTYATKWQYCFTRPTDKSGV